MLIHYYQVSRFNNSCVVLAGCLLLALASTAYSAERLLEADINTRIEYNDNVFLTAEPHAAVSGVIVTPSLSGIIKEQHWYAELNAKLIIQKFSDQAIDGDDQFFNLTAQYSAQRNVFSLNVSHDLDSNLSSTATDFGIVGRRVERKSQSITPKYTRLLTERLTLDLSYTYSDIDYLAVANTAFTPYVSDTGSASLLYDLTEKIQLSFFLQAIDYSSKEEQLTYQLYSSHMGIEHKFSKSLSIDILLGVSRRKASNLVAQSFDSSGQVVAQTQQVDFTDRGLLLDAGISQQRETGSIKGRFSRNNTTNSFGGLDQVDRIKVTYTDKISSLWRYDISLRFENIISLSQRGVSVDRNLLFFEARTFYSISEKWSVSASYRYIEKEFKNDTSKNRNAQSTRIFVSLHYNTPSLLTF